MKSIETEFYILTTSERDARIANLKNLLSEKESQINNLNKDIEKLYDQLSSLNQILAECNGQIYGLNQVVAERDAAVALVDKMYFSRSWRITRPLRLIARLFRYGITREVCLKIDQALRSLYYRLPFPTPFKEALKLFYRRIFTNPYMSAQRYVKIFKASSIKPIAQQATLPDYIIWGVIDWHFRFQRPQQLAQALAASGRRIFYVSSVLVSNEHAGFDVEPLDASSRLFQIKLYAKGSPVIYHSGPGKKTISQLRAGIGEVLKWADSREIISLIQHPFWYDIATVLPNCRVVYDCMDHHAGFGNNAPEILSLETALFRNADLTITSSAWLDEAVAGKTSRHILIRNACDFDHFSSSPETSNGIDLARPIIGYYGAIAEWFDQDLVKAVAKRFPECTVLLIGADTVNAQANLFQIPNIKFIGEVRYTELPQYLHSFKVCLLPFKINALTQATNPVKVYEYLSAGKAVVSVDLPEMKQFGDLVRVGTNAEGFLSAISDVLYNPDTKKMINKRQTFAQNQTWMQRVNALITHVESTDYGPKASVIVVTYNNINFTRSCLESLDRYSDYAALEIIVVDNASIDGTRDFLSGWADAASNRKLILNSQNVGFAAANNQGLAIADGEYLVLLNNDTYVTPGWVGTLIRHLKRDKSIGLIGPVTNNIGNEAKVAITYRDMDEMLQGSAQYTRDHIGQTFELHTAAFFCVMIHRQVYELVGPLEEAYGQGFFEDDDYCRRIEQLGLRIVCAEDVFVHHHLSATFDKLEDEKRQALFEHNKAIYEAKWGNWKPHTYRAGK